MVNDLILMRKEYMINKLKLYFVLVLLVSINSLCFAANVGNELDNSARNINKIKDTPNN